MYLCSMVVRLISPRRLFLAAALLLAGVLLAASPQSGRQNQAAVPTLIIARLRLYSKVPVLY